MAQKGAAAAAPEVGGCLGTSKSNAARHFRRTVTRFNLALRVPISYTYFRDEADTFCLPYLHPKNLMKLLLEQHPDLLLGGYMPGIGARRELSQFWEHFRLEQPTHRIFQEPPAKLAWTIPISLHGDGGRTQKKMPLEAVSFEPTLGINSASAAAGDCVGQCRCRHPVAWSVQRLNSRHNSYLSRFLMFAFASKDFPKGLLEHMLSVVSEQLAALFTDGIPLAGSRPYYVCVLGLKGDMDFHCQSLQLTRSFMNVGTVRQNPICPQCLAGSEAAPFEDCNVGAVWESTMYASHPWRSPPPFASIQFESWTQVGSRAADFFKRDPLHIFRLGVLVSNCSWFAIMLWVPICFFCVSEVSIADCPKFWNTDSRSIYVSIYTHIYICI